MRLFMIYLMSLFQNESSCKKYENESDLNKYEPVGWILFHISESVVSNEDSFWHKDKKQLGHGLLNHDRN